MSDHDEMGAFLVGFIVGGLTGAIVTLLFAPKSGEETSALIKDKYIELRDKARSSLDEILDRTYEIAGDASTLTDAEVAEATEPAEPSGSGGDRPGIV